MNKKEKAKKLDAILAEQDVANFNASLNRARSINIGTCFNGAVEVSMRGSDGVFLWAPVQQFEVVELIHQMASSIGCHIHIQPRDDFSSWREWRQAPVESGKNVDPQSNLQSVLPLRSELNEQTVATQKTVGRKRAKRAAAAA